MAGPSSLRRVFRWATRQPQRRILLIVAALALAGLGAEVIYSSSGELAAAADNLGRINPGWLLVAAALEVASFVSFAQGLRVLLRAANRPVGLLALTGLATAGQAMANIIPAGVAASSLYTFRQLLRRGVDLLVSGESQVVQSLLYAATLGLLALVGAEVAGSSTAIPDLQLVALGLLAVILVLVVGAVVLHRRGLDTRAVRWLVVKLSPDQETADRLQAHSGRLSPGTGAWLAATLAVAGTWVFDCGCLAASFLALGSQVPWRGLLLAYCAGQLATMLPVSPGGLGVVEGSLTLALVAFGGAEGNTLAAVLLYRLLSYWSVLPIGLVSHLLLRRSHRATADELTAVTSTPREVVP